MFGRKTSAYRFLVGKGKSPLGRPRHRYKVNNKTNLKNLNKRH
jgi:hypothetical protein